MYHVCFRDLHRTPKGEGLLVCCWEALTLESGLHSSFAFLTWLQIRKVIFPILDVYALRQSVSGNQPLMAFVKQFPGRNPDLSMVRGPVIHPHLKHIQYSNFMYDFTLWLLINKPNQRGGNRSTEWNQLFELVIVSANSRTSMLNDSGLTDEWQDKCLTDGILCKNRPSPGS